MPGGAELDARVARKKVSQEIAGGDFGSGVRGMEEARQGNRKRPWKGGDIEMKKRLNKGPVKTQKTFYPALT